MPIYLIFFLLKGAIGFRVSTEVPTKPLYTTPDQSQVFTVNSMLVFMQKALQPHLQSLPYTDGMLWC